MIKIIDNRGTGKTKKLIKEAYENNLTLLVKDNLHKKGIIDKALSMGIPGISTMTYSEFKDHDRCGTDYYLVDDLDEYLKFISDNKIVGYSLTNED